MTGRRLRLAIGAVSVPPLTARDAFEAAFRAALGRRLADPRLAAAAGRVELGAVRLKAPPHATAAAMAEAAAEAVCEALLHRFGEAADRRP